MSKEGVQNHLKNGGAHVASHETSLLLRLGSNSQENTNKASIWEDLGVPSDAGLIQDGGAGDVIIQEPAFDVFNFDTEHLSLDENTNGDDITGILEANYSRPVSIAGTEWLKGSNGSEGISIVTTSSSSAPTVPNNDEGHLEMAQTETSSKNVPRDLGELFAISSVSDINTDIPTFSLAESLGPVASNKLSGSGNCHSSPVSPINFLEETPSGRSRSYSDTENDEKIATKAFLEELERGSQLTAEDRELMEMSRKELQAYEFQVLEQDKSNTLLTPQELENLPVQGLEFDESAELSKIKTEATSSATIKQEIKGDSFVESDASAEIVQSSMSFISTANDAAPVGPFFDNQQNLWKIEAPKEKGSSVIKTMLLSNNASGTPKNNMVLTAAATNSSNRTLKSKVASVNASGSNNNNKSMLLNKIIRAVATPVTSNNVAATSNKANYKKTSKSGVAGNNLKRVSTTTVNASSNSKRSVPVMKKAQVVPSPSNTSHVGIKKDTLPTLSIDERNVARVVVTNKPGKEEVFHVDPARLIPVQIQPPSKVATAAPITTPKAGATGVSGRVSSVSSAPILLNNVGTVTNQGLNGSVTNAAAGTQLSSGNIQLTAVPMLYVKDGCLVIPIQQIQTLATPDTSSSVTTTTLTSSSETAAAAASVTLPATNTPSANQSQNSGVVNVDSSATQPKATNQSAVSAAKPNVKKTETGTGKTKVKSGGSGRSRAAEEKDKWTCSICQEKFSRLYKLKLHIMKHTGEKPFKCTFPDCKWAFTTAFKLRRHEECHLGKKDYVCEFQGCGKQFTTVYNLNTHKKSHLRRMTVECTTCGEKFSTQRQLDYHMRNKRHGEKEEAYECPHEGCGRKFFSRYCMGSHMRVHQHARMYPCPEEGCDRLFDKQCRLQQHLRSHTGEKPYKCMYANCGIAFSTQSKLKRHTRKHTGERRWVCNVEGCGKAFMRSEHLRAHTITHTGEKPFHCTIPDCNARFKCKSSLYVHLKRHAENAKKSQDPNYVAKPQRGSKYTNKAAMNMKNNYNRQLQNALGDLFTLINAEELESLITTQVDQQMTTAGGTPAPTTSDITVASEPFSINNLGQTNLNPTDILSVNLDGQQTIITNLHQPVTSIPPGTSFAPQQAGATSLLAAPSSVGQVLAQVGPTVTSGLGQADLLAAQGLLSTTVGLSDGFGPIINIQPVSAKPGGKGKNMVTALRSDSTSSRGKKKKNTGSKSETKVSSLVSKTSHNASSSHPSLTAPPGDDSLSTAASVAVNPNEIVTSRAITFRDPETGAIYVQTQLLQDDPPNPDLYTPLDGDCGVICLDASSVPDPAASDLPSMLLDAPPPGVIAKSTVDMISDSPSAPIASGVLEFTGTTINLQDLE